MRQRYATRNVPILSDLKEEAITRVSLFAAFKTYRHGETIYAQDSPPEAFYIVLDGEVKVSVKAAYTAAQAAVGGLARGNPKQVWKQTLDTIPPNPKL